MPQHGTPRLSAAELQGDADLLRRALRSSREVLDISQERWASILGVSMSTVARWESDNPQRHTVAPPLAIHLYRELYRRPEYRERLAQRPDVVVICVAAGLLPSTMLGTQAA